MPVSDGDRYRPLPPLTRLPAYVWRQLPGAARIALALLAVGVVVAAVVMAPRISDNKRDADGRERRENAAAGAARVRRLRALQRPNRARAASIDPGAGASRAVRERKRRGLLQGLDEAIAADARARGGTPVLRGECHGDRDLPAPARDLARRRRSLACLAVTSDIPASHASSGGTVGYPYRAVVDFPSGRLTWCRIAGRPGEGSFDRQVVAVPRVCTG